MKRLVWIFAALVLTAACGPDEDDGSNITFDRDATGPDAGMDMSVADVSAEDASDGGSTGDAANDAAIDMGRDSGTNNGTPCGEDTCTAGRECQNDVCVVLDSCVAADDAGTLEVGTPIEVTGSLAGDGADTLAASCGNDDQRERVVSFELTETAEVSWEADWMGQFDGLVELRSTCDDANSELACSDVESGSAVLEAGTYYVVLEARLGNPGDFTLTLTARAATCTPGTTECVADELEVCSDPAAPDRFQCAGGCEASLCAGDTCGNAIQVTAGTGGTFAGHGGGYDDALDFSANADCTTADQMPIATPGYEVVFFLPGLEQGDIVSVDAATNDANVNAIFILSACDDTSACVATYKDEQPDWVVDSPGDYFLVIDKRQASTTEFQYSVTIL